MQHKIIVTFWIKFSLSSITSYILEQFVLPLLKKSNFKFAFFFCEKEGTILNSNISTLHPRPFTAKPLDKLELHNATPNTITCFASSSSSVPVAGDAHQDQNIFIFRQDARLQSLDVPHDPAPGFHQHASIPLKEHRPPARLKAEEKHRSAIASGRTSDWKRSLPSPAPPPTTKTSNPEGMLSFPPFRKQTEKQKISGWTHRRSWTHSHRRERSRERGISRFLHPSNRQRQTNRRKRKRTQQNPQARSTWEQASNPN